MDNGKVGEIVAIRHTPGSGMLTIMVKNDQGQVEPIAADNGPIIRAFEDAFGGVIGPGHTFNKDAVVGKRIRYWMTDYGTMEGFIPEDA